MQSVVFREYDLRGIVGTQLQLELVYDLGRAIAVLFTELHPATKTIAIGMDGRTHSLAIKDELVRGLRDSGIDVIFLGVCPTPVLYFSQFTMPVDAGLMITASHNPLEYNGIKFCLNKMPVWGAQLTKLHALMVERVHIDRLQGSYSEVDGNAAYIDFLVDHFAHLKGIDSNVIFDCGNAVGGLIMPELIKRFGWKNASTLYAELDGTFPHHEPDPVVEANMQDLKQQILLKNEGAGSRPCWGIGLDGDCDRMAVMTQHGYLVPGDQLLAIFSQDVLKEHPGATVVFDVRSSTLLETVIKEYGGVPYLSACGHATIKEAIRTEKAVLAGELSCHFCFNDRYYGYDDGIYAALRMMELLQKIGTTIDSLVVDLPYRWNTPEIRVACPEEHKRSVVQEVKQYFSKRTDATLLTIDGVRVQLTNGWGLVRSSNTQAAISLRFEAESADALQEIRTEFATLLMPYVDADAYYQIGGMLVAPLNQPMNGYQL